MDKIESPIAERHLTYVTKDGESHPFYYSIGPCYEEDGHYHCPMTIKVFGTTKTLPTDSFDAYDAIINSIELLHINFSYYQKNGDFFWPALENMELKTIFPKDYCAEEMRDDDNGN